jgi:hypothetical protein
MAPLAAVAECQAAFPDMVVTLRPWRDLFDGFAPWKMFTSEVLIIRIA